MPDDVRAFANLPREVPEAHLSLHIATATRDLVRRTSLTSPEADQVTQWREAIIVAALMRAFPWLNTFALDGAAKIGRLEGSVEYRFLEPQDVEARVKALNARFDELVDELTPATIGQPQSGGGSMTLTAI